MNLYNAGARLFVVLILTIPLTAITIHKLARAQASVSPEDIGQEAARLSPSKGPRLITVQVPIVPKHVRDLSSDKALPLMTIVVELDRMKPPRSWDPVGGKPDPYIVVNDISYRTSRCQNRYTCKFLVRESGPLEIAVWDADVMNDDFVGAAICHKGHRCPIHKGEIRVH